MSAANQRTADRAVVPPSSCCTSIDRHPDKISIKAANDERSQSFSLKYQRRIFHWIYTLEHRKCCSLSRVNTSENYYSAEYEDVRTISASTRCWHWKQISHLAEEMKIMTFGMMRTWIPSNRTKFRENLTSTIAVQMMETIPACLLSPIEFRIRHLVPICGPPSHRLPNQIPRTTLQFFPDSHLLPYSKNEQALNFQAFPDSNGTRTFPFPLSFGRKEHSTLFKSLFPHVGNTTNHLSSLETGSAFRTFHDVGHDFKDFEKDYRLQEQSNAAAAAIASVRLQWMARTGMYLPRIIDFNGEFERNLK